MEFGELLRVLSGLKAGVSVRLGERFLIVQSRWLKLRVVAFLIW